jgi:hypothetical protein
MKKGTILIPTGSTEHLHFICCDTVFYPHLGKDCVLVVNISSIDDDLEYDKTCLLDVGDHPFVTHQSYVYYRKAAVYGANNISRNVAEGNFRIHQPCSEITFNRILNGFSESEEVSFKIKRFYEIYCK